MRAILLLVCLFVSPAFGQDSFAPTRVTASTVEQIVRQSMPAPATALPPATALDGLAGSSTDYARADHTHAARVQRIAMTTAADGTVTWTFARPVVVPTGKVPPIAYMVEDKGSPVVVQVIDRSFTTSGSVDIHTAVKVRAQRSRTLPAMLVTVADLVGFNVFQVAANVLVDLWAADPTQ